jgi:ribokinase
MISFCVLQEVLMIFVAGSANLDFVVRASHIPGIGETVLGQNFRTYPGGKGANQAVACARAGGATTHMLLSVGQDSHAEPLLTSLSHAHVSVHKVLAPDQPTGCAFICVADSAENAITVAPGANLALESQHLPDLSGFTHLLMQLEIPLTTVTAYAVAAKSQGVKVVLNAAPAQQLPVQLLEAVDILIVNEGELASLVPYASSVMVNLAQVAVPCVVVTLGHRGCVARLGNNFFTQTAFRVEAIDTTGAGDTFCGVLVAALDRGDNMTEAMRQANAAAALACTQHGAQSSIPTVSEVSAFLAQQGIDSPADTESLRSYCGLS